MAGTLIATNRPAVPAVAGTSAGMTGTQVAAVRTADGQPVMPLVPFTRASRERIEPAQDSTHTLGAGTSSVGPLDIPAFGYLRGVYLLVEGTGGTGAAAAALADAPFSVLDEIQLTDVNGNPLFGPLSGFECYLAQKYGAYEYISDARQSPVYRPVQVDGSFAFLIRIPVEITGRTALGSLANQNSSQTFKLRYSISPSTRLYATPPTTLPTVRVRAYLDAWAQPAPSNVRGEPNETMPLSSGTTQYWQRSTTGVAIGAQNVSLSRVGNLIRTIVFIHRNPAGARIEGQFPNPTRLTYDGNLVEDVALPIIRHRMASRYGLINPLDTPGGLDTGVIVYEFTHDFDGKAGYELHDLYLGTTQASRVELSGSFGAAGNLTVLYNDIAPAGNIFVAA